MKKLIAMLAAATLLVSGLCSCGDSGSKKKDKEKSSKTSHSDSKDKNGKDSDDDDDDDDDDDKESGKKDKDKDKDGDDDNSKDKNKEKDKDSSSKVSSSVSESDFAGKWELVKYVIDGEDMSEYMTDDLPVYALGQLEIKENGKAKMKTSYAYDDEIDEDTTNLMWEMKDSKTASFYEDEDDNERVLAVFEDDYLVMYSEDDEETKLYFEKVNSFHKIELPDVKDTAEPTTKPSIIGSGTSANSEDIAGKWECSEYKSGESDFDLAEMFGAEISAIFKMEIGSDGKGKLYMFKGSDDEDSTDMEFTSLGNGKYSMIEGLDDDEYTVTVDGDTLTMSMATESLTFKRVKEFTETDWDKVFDDMMNQYGGQ